MAVLNIRNLPEEVHQRLRVQAAHNHRSMEAEARAILAAALPAEDAHGLGGTSGLQAWVDRLYGEVRPRSTVDDLLAERRLEAEREAQGAAPRGVSS